MRRVDIIAAVGLCVTAACVYLVLRADALATTWQPPSSNGNAWGGVTDPSLRHTYQLLGMAGLCFGLVLLALAAGRWLGITRGQMAR